MIPINRKIDRRRVLRGMLGGTAVTVALPFLDCFLNTNGTALADGQALPVCFGTWFWGLGMNPGRWEPPTPGKITEFGPELAGLTPYKDKVNVYSGTKVILDGRPMITHFTGDWAVLTGTTPREERVILPSVDQLIADVIGTKTRFRSIEVSSTGNAVHSYSRRAGAAVNPAEVSPAALYTRIFGPEFKDPNAADFKPDPQIMARQSVLTAVMAQRDDLSKTLGAADKARLEEYFTSLRQIEQQLELELQKPAPLAACSSPAKPVDVVLGSEIESVKGNHKLFAQILAHALACNQTRVINVTFNDATSSLRKQGSSMTHHVYTHEESIDPQLGYQPNVTAFIMNISSGLGDMVAALDSVKEGDGTLLDRMLLMASTDTGYAKVHSLDDIPLITAGRAGGKIKTGLHVVAKGDPSTRLGLTVQQAVGVPINSWGTDSMQTSKTFTEVMA
jgi:Protein of unknown function (DUF1552)